MSRWPAGRPPCPDDPPEGNGGEGGPHGLQGVPASARLPSGEACPDRVTVLACHARRGG